ncbi:MAG: DUF2267 domain-containing protein [Anaerolineae bacterium]
MDRAYFVGRMQSGLVLEKPSEAERVTRGVLGVLAEAVTPGEWADVAGQLPVALWETMAGR